MSRPKARAALRANPAIMTTVGILAASLGPAIVAAAVDLVLGARRLRAALRTAQDLRELELTISSRLASPCHEAERWRREAEVAELWNASATTVRRQARSLYRRGGSSGHHEVAAFFVADPLTPRPAGAANALSVIAGRSE